jgi:phosphohistidine swiveling domain-containing protein
VTGASRATELIKDGTIVEVDGGAGVVRILGILS